MNDSLRMIVVGVARSLILPEVTDEQLT